MRAWRRVLIVSHGCATKASAALEQLPARSTPGHRSAAPRCRVRACGAHIGHDGRQSTVDSARLGSSRLASRTTQLASPTQREAPAQRAGAGAATRTTPLQQWGGWQKPHSTRLQRALRITVHGASTATGNHGAAVAELSTKDRRGHAHTRRTFHKKNLTAAGQGQRRRPLAAGVSPGRRSRGRGVRAPPDQRQGTAGASRQRREAEHCRLRRRRYLLSH